MGRKKKSKNLTAVLALFFGFWGVHRFYLGQRGNGAIYFLLFFVGISFLLGIIDFLSFLFMDTETFDRRYNNAYEEQDFNRASYTRFVRKKSSRRSEAREPGRPVRARRVSTIQRVSPNSTRLKALIQTGKSHYDNFDYFEAIAQWEKALEMSPTHIAVHYNLACAYSLTEQADEGFHHLSQAVKHGFKDFDKLNDQDALAFLRIQPQFIEFAENKFVKPNDEPVKDKAPAPQPRQATAPPAKKKSILAQPDLLQQLKELGELRDRGLLTDEEFLSEKKKLL